MLKKLPAFQVNDATPGVQARTAQNVMAKRNGSKLLNWNSSSKKRAIPKRLYPEEDFTSKDYLRWLTIDNPTTTATEGAVCR
jgi:hypothetical protein